MNRSLVMILAAVLVMGFISIPAAAQHFQFVRTDVNMSILVQSATINDADLEEGDEIGVFTPGGDCAGASVVPAEGFPVGVSANAREGNNPGFQAGNDIAFRMWDRSADREVVANAQHVQGVENFEANGFKVVRISGNFEAAPRIAVSHDSFDFGAVRLETEASFEFEISNVGDAELVIHEVTVEGDGFSADQMDRDMIIDIESSHVFSIYFSPQTEAEVEGYVNIFSNDADNEHVRIQLMGSGFEQNDPELLVSPDDLNFGEVLVNESASLSFSITNIGAGELELFDVWSTDENFTVDFIAPEPEEFDWAYERTDVSMSLLVSEATIDGNTLVGGDFIGVFNSEGICAGFSEVNDNFPEEMVGVAAWQREGNRPGFAANDEITFRIWDSRSEMEYSVNAEFTNGPNRFEGNAFSVVVLEAVEVIRGGANSILLAADESIDVEVTFSPTRQGQFGGEVIVESQFGQYPVSLFGIGFEEVVDAPEILFEPNSIDFGNVEVDNSGEGHSLIWNIGNADLVIENIYTEGEAFSTNWQQGGGEEFDWDFVRTDVSHSLLINSVMIGENSVSEGDYVGVFTPRGQAAGFTMVTDAFPDEAIGIAAWQESGNDAGFRGGEEFEFRIWDSASGQEWSANAEFSFGPQNFEANAFTVLSLSANELLRGGDADAVVVGPEGNFELTVWFTPREEGEYQGSVVVVSNDPRGDMRINLTGVGFMDRAPMIDLMTESLNFGEVFVNEMAEGGILVRNIGNADLVISNIIVGGEGFSSPAAPSAGEFSWDFVRTDVSHSLLINSAMIGDRDVRTGDFVGVFTSRGDCAGLTEVMDTYPDEAIGIAAWQESGNDAGFRANEDFEFRIWDSEAGQEWLADAEFTFGPQQYEANAFSVLSLNSSRMLGGGEWEDVVLAPNEGWEIPVVFAPEFEGEFRGSLTVISNDQNNETVSADLFGVGVLSGTPRIQVSHESFDFGSVMVGENGVFNLIVGNTGEVDLEITAMELSDGENFAVFGGNHTIEANSEVAFEVHFRPGMRGDFESLLTIFSNDENNDRVGVNLMGMGVAPVIVLSADMLDFGEVFIDDEAGLELTISNDGDADLVVSNFTFDTQIFAIRMEQIEREFDWEFVRTDVNHSIIVSEAMIGDASLEVGDYIGVFTNAGICAGYAQVTDEGFPVGMSAWQQEGQNAGFSVDEEIGYRYWDASAMREIQAFGVYSHGEGNFEANGFSVVSLSNNPNRDLEEPIVIGPGENVTGTVFFRPDAEGRFEDHMLVESNDPANRDAAVHLIGVGVQRNVAPMWDRIVEDFEANEGELIAFEILAVDENDDEIMLTMTDLDENLPESAMFESDGGNGMFEWDVDYESAGTYRLMFTASDGMAETWFIVTITVNDVNRAPEWVEDPSGIVEAFEGDVLMGTLVAMDPDGNDIQYFVEFSDIPEHVMFVDNGDGTADFTWETNYEDAGEYTAVIGITDGELANYATIEFVIYNTNREPMWAEYPEFVMADEGDMIEFMITVEDPDGDMVEFTWDRNGLPMSANLNDNGDNSATFMWETDHLSSGEFAPIFFANDGEFEIQLSINIVVTDVLYHFVDFAITDANHSVLVLEAMFEGEAIPSGWEVGAFTPAGLLAGGDIWFDGEELGLAAWGDDAGTDETDGFRNGERMSFKLWDDRADREYDASATLIEGSLLWQANGFSVITLNAYESRAMSVDLRDGWNLISINVVPDPDFWRQGEERGPDIQMMLAQLRPDQQQPHSVIIIKDDRGRFFAPRVPFDNLRYWDLNEGYAIRVEGANHSLNYRGTPIPFDADIVIPEGWNYIPYYPTFDLEASRASNYHVLSPIIDDVIIAKNGLGRFLAPANNFSNMPPWTEGQGYQVRVARSVVLNYPSNDNNASIAANDPWNEPIRGFWNEPDPTGFDMSVLVRSFVGEHVGEGDLVAAFNTEGVVVGVGRVNEDGQAGLAVWGQDQTSTDEFGLVDTEVFSLKLYSSANETVYDLGVMDISFGEGLKYETDGFIILDAKVEAVVPTTHYLSGAYPNPFNNATRINYGLAEAGKVSIKIYDLTGRIVSSLVEADMTAGNHNAVWDASKITSGVYLVKMETANFSESRKIVLMK